MKEKLKAAGIDQKPKEIKYKLLKTPTGIKGFDEITFGGLPKNRPTLLVGGIGCGKTFMSMEFILNGIERFNEPGVFMTFEEKTEELIVNVASFGYDIDQLIAENKIYLEHLDIGADNIKNAGNYNIEGLFVRLEYAINKINAKRVVLDSLDTLFASLNAEILRCEFKRLFSWLKEKNVTAIITAERGENFLTRMGIEEWIADCVVELNNRVTNQIAVRRLRIVKYRGSEHVTNEFPFSIDKNGMSIFPMISEISEQSISSECLSSGIKELDDMLGKKGFYKGSSILISGSAGTGKTSIASSFVDRICRNNIRCLFCTFEEAPNQIIRNMKAIGTDLKYSIDDSYLHFYYARPSLQNLELHFIAIKDIISYTKPEVIILDPITNLMTEGTSIDVRSMLTRFIDYLKTQRITVMFLAAITQYTININPSDEGITSMTDTWIMLDEIPINGERTRRLQVMKSRGMAHAKDVREFVISDDGINLIPIIKSKGNVLVGSARETEQKNLKDKKK